ncbi:MAG: tetratricopeptide repeat protein [Acidobacteriota bacterium]
MQKKYLFGLIGLAIGIAVSFWGTRAFNNNNLTAGTTAPGAGTNAPMSSSGGQQAMMGDVSKTIEAAKNNPKDFNAQVEAAKVHAQIGQDDQAVGYLEKAYAADPKQFADINASGYVGQFYFEQKKYADAEIWFTRALAENPKEPDVEVMLAKIFMNREPADPDKAVQHLQAALKLDAKNGHALGHLVEAYALKKDARGAEEALKKLQETEPTNNRIASLQTMVADLKAGKAVTIPKE